MHWNYIQYHYEHYRFTTNIRFRIDFFSIPGTCRRIVDAIFSINNDCVPELRLMTSYDQNLIDLDSISSVLDVTLEEILQKQVFIFQRKLLADMNHGCMLQKTSSLPILQLVRTHSPLTLILYRKNWG